MKEINGSGKKSVQLDMGDSHITFEQWLRYEDGHEECIDVYTNPIGAHNQTKSMAVDYLMNHFCAIASSWMSSSRAHGRVLETYIKQVTMEVVMVEKTESFNCDDYRDEAIARMNKSMNGSTLAQHWDIDFSKIP